MSKYYPPQYKSQNFNCPFCNVYATQWWESVGLYDWVKKEFKDELVIDQSVSDKLKEIQISICNHCKEFIIWLSEEIIYPVQSMAPPVNSDLPDEIKAVYEEAATIANLSPRAACALLRYGLELLLESVGKTGSLNTNIGKLVEGGLTQQIQQALDIVRVTGNHAVHPKEIDFNDTTDVHSLFKLINVIADTLITQPKQIEEIYDNLPEKDKKAIEKRDDNNP